MGGGVQNRFWEGFYVVCFPGQGLVFCLRFTQKMLKTAEKMLFLAALSATNLGRPFCSFPFPPFYMLFYLSKSQKSRQKTRPPPFSPPLSFPHPVFFSDRPLRREPQSRKFPWRKSISPTTLHTVSGSTPTPWSGPFRDHGLRPWSRSQSEHRKP